MAGLKITSIAQFPPEGKLDGHVLVSAKSMPEALMSRTVTAELLMLVSVAVLSGLAWVYELRLLASLRNYYLPSKSRVSLNTVPQPYGK
jgi:hypothetical protein